MKILNISIILLIFCSFGFAQVKPDRLTKKKSSYSEQKAEKVNSISKNEKTKTTETVNKIIKQDNTNTINIQKTNQKVDPVKVQNAVKTKDKEKKSFGSATSSEPETILKKKPVQQQSADSEVKEKVKKLLKIKSVNPKKSE